MRARTVWEASSNLASQRPHSQTPNRSARVRKRLDACHFWILHEAAVVECPPTSAFRSEAEMLQNGTNPTLLLTQLGHGASAQCETCWRGITSANLGVGDDQCAIIRNFGHYPSVQRS